MQFWQELVVNSLGIKFFQRENIARLCNPVPLPPPTTALPSCSPPLLVASPNVLIPSPLHGTLFYFSLFR